MNAWSCLVCRIAACAAAHDCVHEILKPEKTGTCARGGGVARRDAGLAPPGPARGQGAAPRGGGQKPDGLWCRGPLAPDCEMRTPATAHFPSAGSGGLAQAPFPSRGD